MKYELHIFEQIINSALSPFIDDISDPHKYNNAIYEKHKKCFICTVATFKKSKEKFVLLDKITFSSLHPSAERMFNPQQTLFKVADIQDVAPDALKLLKLDKQNIISISYTQHSNKTLVYIKEYRTCSDIPFNEAKYYYYQDLLKSEVARIKEVIKDAVFTNTISGGIEEYIHKMHQALINLCFSLMKMWDLEQQNDIYIACNRIHQRGNFKPGLY